MTLRSLCGHLARQTRGELVQAEFPQKPHPSRFTSALDLAEPIVVGVGHPSKGKPDQPKTTLPPCDDSNGSLAGRDNHSRQTTSPRYRTTLRQLTLEG
jgi:hypothetical protein